MRKLKKIVKKVVEKKVEAKKAQMSLDEAEKLLAEELAKPHIKQNVEVFRKLAQEAPLPVSIKAGEARDIWGSQEWTAKELKGQL